MRAGWIAGIAVFALASACARPHVTLPTVTPDLSPEQRVQMFNDLHATGEKTVTTTTCGRGCSTSTEKTLYLANGTRVYYPEDLLPVVAPDSATARAVADVHTARRKALGYAGISVASAVGFVAIMLLSFGNDDPGLAGLEKAGMVASVAGMVVGGFGAWYQNHKAVEHWGVANESYNEGLGQRLNVCTSGFAVVPCESGTPPPSAQPAEVKPITR